MRMLSVRFSINKKTKYTVNNYFPIVFPNACCHLRRNVASCSSLRTFHQFHWQRRAAPRATNVSLNGIRKRKRDRKQICKVRYSMGVPPLTTWVSFDGHHHHGRRRVAWSGDPPPPKAFVCPRARSTSATRSRYAHKFCPARPRSAIILEPSGQIFWYSTGERQAS